MAKKAPRDKTNYLQLIEPLKKGYQGRYLCSKCNTECVKVIKLVNQNKLRSCGCGNEFKKNKHSTSHALYNWWRDIKNDGGWDNWGNYDLFYEWAINQYEIGFSVHKKDIDKQHSKNNSYFKLDVVQHVYNAEKTKQTCMERYGVENPRQIPGVSEKIKKTCLEKYGAESPFGNKEIQKKITETLFKNHGITNPGLSKEFREKGRQTCLKRYGVRFPQSLDSVKDKQSQTKIEKYGSPYYSGTIHHKQNEIQTLLESYGIKCETKRINGKEIDIYCPDFNIGIEYCGLHWHHEQSKEPRNNNYHIYKYNICKEAGIQLYTVFSDEWEKKKDITKSLLLSKFNLYNTKVFARTLKIKENIDSEIIKKFLDENHLLGYGRKPKYSVGLFDGDNINGLITLNKHHRNIQETVLDRLCFAKDTSIVGGTARMLKTAKKWCVSEGINQIKTWSDNRYSDGGIYLRNNFTLLRVDKQDYQYVNIQYPRERYSKQSFNKKTIKAGPNQTERDRALEMGYARIWDCGKKCWITNIHN